MTVLTPRSERIRSARSLVRRSSRVKRGLFLAEGRQAVSEALAETALRPGLVTELFVDAGTTAHDDLLARAAELGVPVRLADTAALAELSETVTPQGLVATCRLLTTDLGTAVDGTRLITILANIRDPGNAGTVIRTADAAGADGVVLTHGSVDPHSGKCVRASAGSVFHLPIATDATLEDAVVRAHANGLTVLAADGAGTLDLDEAEDSGLLARPAAWLFGNEAWGLPPDLRALADHVVRIPMRGRAESLNLATAAAVCLYASARVHRRADRSAQ